MRISIEVGHPAHVHYWRNVKKILESRGHEITIFAREKEITLQLLDAFGLQHTTVGKSRRTIVEKALGLGLDDFRVLRAARANRIEFMLSTGIPGSAHASRVLGVPHVALIDTEIATLGRLLTVPFSDAVCTPACFRGHIDPSKHVTFQGYLELMYLHPVYFHPDPVVLDEAGLARGDSFAIVRFSSWDSSHDLGRNGRVLTTNAERLALVRAIAEKVRVFVSSEVPLPVSFEPFLMRLRPNRFHDLLSFASVYVGEGAKMASEAGVLGIPWVYVSTSPRSYLSDQEHRFGLGKTATSFEEALRLADRWSDPSVRDEWATRKGRLLSETIDVSRFMADFVEKWPDIEPFKEAGVAGRGG